MRPCIVRVCTGAKFVTTLSAAALLMCAVPARAQLNGENLLGDMGVKSGTQPQPGVYASYIYYRYSTESIKAANGNSASLDPTGNASQTIHANVPLILWVTPKKVLGAQFGMMAVLPLANGSLEAPGLELSENASIGLSDLYVMPAQLGWHFDRADAIAGIAFFAPTGRYSAGASDNLGKGMWSYEVSGGGTIYGDAARTVSISTTAFWETHSKKEGELHAGRVAMGDVKVGQLLTLEGGAGKSFLHGAASVGAAYYAQWKLTTDTFSVMAHPLTIPDKHRVFAFGPDVTIPIAAKTKLISLVNVRYMWEAGAQTKTQGPTLMLTWTVPMGGVAIPQRKESLQ